MRGKRCLCTLGFGLERQAGLATFQTQGISSSMRLLDQFDELGEHVGEPSLRGTVNFGRLADLRGRAGMGSRVG